MRSAIPLLLLLAGGAARAAEDGCLADGCALGCEPGAAPAAAPAAASAEVASAEECFQRIAALAGAWEMTDPTGRRPPVRLEYQVTSNGNAVVEREHAGSDDEMISVWFVRDGRLHLTHYCHLDNRPEMAVVASDATSLTLSLVDGSIADPAEPHMHALTLTRPDEDHVRQLWSFFEGGELAGYGEFVGTRVPVR